MTETSTIKVHLMRHGEVHNPERIVYGRLPGYRLVLSAAPVSCI